MSRYQHLQSIQVSKPCPQQWDDMVGDDKARHCAHCQKNVHNLSSLTKEEAAQILASESAPCVRFVTDKKGRPVFKLIGIGAIWAALLSAFGCNTLSTGATGEAVRSPAKPVSSDGMIGKVAVPLTSGKKISSTGGEHPRVLVGEAMPDLSRPQKTSAPHKIKKPLRK